jgi:hypothetical protein
MPFDAQTFEPDDIVLDAIRATRAFHSDPANWCNTGVGAHDGAQCIVFAATSRLPVASFLACGEDDRFAASMKLLATLQAALPPGATTLVHFNEMVGTTHAQLMEFYDRAYELRRAALVARMLENAA